MDLREVLASLKVGWWLLGLGLVAGAGSALAVSMLATPLYTATTQLFVSTTSASSTQEAFQGSMFSQQRVASYAQLLTGEELAQRVVDRLDLDVTPGRLSQQITASAAPDTVLLDISVTDASPERAQLVASALGQEFVEFVSELETPQGGGTSPVLVTVTERPDLPAYPSSPQPERNVVLGALAGLLLGAVLAVARARLDRSIKDGDVAADLGGAPTIGTILRDPEMEKGFRHTVERSGANRTAEDYRQLRANLQFLRVDEPPKVIMVSSAMPSEGKTTVVINLAMALVDSGRRVTIIEADLRRPKVTQYLGMVGSVGLTNVLAGSADIDDVLQRHGEGNPGVIAAGPTPPNPGELLSSSQMAALIDKLRASNDFVLVDAPPLLPVADSTGLAVLVDGVLLSVRYGKTSREQLQQAATTLQRVGATTLGVVLNIVPATAQTASAYGYGYAYEAEKPKRQQGHKAGRRRARAQ